jgi:signal transduction histidine kinase
MSSHGPHGRSYLRQLGRRFLVVGVLFIVGAPTIIYWATRIEQERRLSATTREIARMLAVDVRYPLLVSSADDALQHAEQILRLPDVVAVTVLDDEGGILAQAKSDNLRRVRQRADAVVDVFSEQFPSALDLDQGGERPGTRLGSVTVSVSKDRAHRDSWAIAWQAAVGLLVLTAVLALSTVLLSVRLFRPLSRLARFLETPAPADQPLPGVGEEAVSEARVIHSAVRVMRARMAEDQRLLRRYADGLETMVEERTRQLVAARDRAERANHAKTLFLANVSHELRTPLQAITVLAGLDETAAKRLEASPRQGILAATTQLLDLIEQLLVLSRAESGIPVQCSSEPVQVDRVVAEALRTIEPTLSPGNALAMKSLDPASTVVQSDPTRIRQVLNNLIRNADRYMQNGLIRVEVDGTGSDEVIISVRDDGVGIAGADLARIFEPFYQGPAAAEQTSPGGVGLGLWLSRHIAEALGGRIDAESAPGAGCTFRFHVPRASSQAAPRPRSPSRERTAAQPLSVRNRGARVLLAEDEALIRLPLSIVLREAGFQVDEAADGSTAQRMLGSADGGYDAVVLDHWLPGVHGLELLRAMAQGGRVTTPTIVFTADETPALKAEVRTLGASLMVKPVIAADLAMQIDAAIDGAKQR